MTQLPKETQKNGNTNKLKMTNKHTKYKPKYAHKINTLGPTGLYELVLVAVHMENFQCTAYMPGTTSTALPSFSHDQHHKTDAAKRTGGGDNHQERSAIVLLFCCKFCLISVWQKLTKYYMV